MAWQNKANTAYELSTLGKRQAEVAVLRENGLSSEEIVEHLKDEDENPPHPRTIQSTESKLSQEYRRATVTQTLLVDGYDALHVPRKLPREQQSTDCTVHAYIGLPAAGKTVTAQAHLLRLHENEDADNFIVFDLFGEDGWKILADNTDSITRLTKTDQHTVPTDELLAEIERTESDEHTVVFVEQAHHVLYEQSDFINRVQDMENNTSLRVITSAVDDLPDDETPDVYHFHKLRGDIATSAIRNIEDDSNLRFSSSNAEIPLNFPLPKDAGYTFCLTVLPDTGEELLRPRTLTPNEQTTLIPNEDP